MNRTLLAFLLSEVASGWWLSSARGADDPLALTAREPDPTWEVDTSLVGKSYSIQLPQSQTGGFQEGANLSFTQYLAPLRDDGSPYSLRSFLQRTSALSLSLGVGHFATHNPFGAPDRTDTSGSVGGGLNIYLKRWLAVTGSVGYEYDTLHDVGVEQGTHAVSGSAGLGLRAGDLRLDVSYDISSYHQSGAWGPIRRGLDISGYGVFARRLAVGFGAERIAGGSGGSVNGEYFPSPDLGLFVTGGAVRGNLYRGDQIVTRYAATGGIAGWVDPSTGMVARYSRTIEHAPPMVDGSGYDETGNQISLEVYMLFP